LEFPHWPGNVRELQNTLWRLCVWTDGATIRAADIDVAMLPEYSEAQRAPSALDRPVGDGFSLEAVLDEVAKRYIVRATGEAGGNKSKAARLVGFSSYQRFENWQRKYLNQTPST
jgi:DNA-binding NtrC family response regulator